jgi:hypothetical protein
MQRSEQRKPLGESPCRSVIHDDHSVTVAAVGGPEHRVCAVCCEPGGEGVGHD